MEVFGRLPFAQTLAGAPDAVQTLPLSPLEALHLRAVLAAALERLALVGAVNVDAAAQAQALSRSVGDEIGLVMAEQRELEGRFEELVSAQHELRGQPNKVKLQANEAQLALVSEALHAATQRLCRSLRDNLNVPDNMAKVARERADVAALFAATLEALRVRGGGPAPSVLPVARAVLAQEREEAAARELAEEERCATAAVRQLRQDLFSERGAHDEAMREKRLALAALKEQLRIDKLRLAVDCRHRAKDLAAANQCAVRLQRAELASLSDALALLRQQIEIERGVGAAAAEQLSRAAAARQDDAVGWGSRREEDAHARERQIEVVRAQHQRDAMRLKDLEARLGEEQELKARRDERIREEGEAAERAAADAVRRLRAALRIQAAWRGLKARQQHQAGKGAKKGGGKGKRVSGKK